VNIGSPVVAHGKATELGQPSQGSLDFPAVTPEPFTAVDTAPGDPRNDGAGAALTAATTVIIALVGVELVRTATSPADRRHRIEGGCDHPAVVPVGPADRQAEGRALAIDDQVPLRARLASVRRIRPGLLTPPFARTEALSSEARIQSSRSALRSRSSRARCSARQTPAACHSTSRRQHVLPRCSPSLQARPATGCRCAARTEMPASATRSGTRGLPPFGFGGSAGNSGASAAQRSSGTRGDAIAPQRPGPGFVLGSKGTPAVGAYSPGAEPREPASRHSKAPLVGRDTHLRSGRKGLRSRRVQAELRHQLRRFGRSFLHPAWC
jgi:hypothetical protein